MALLPYGVNYEEANEELLPGTFVHFDGYLD